MEAINRPLAQLCAMCQNLFDHWDELKHAPYLDEVSELHDSKNVPRIKHHGTLEDVEAAADSKCGFCILLLGSVSPDKPEEHGNNVPNRFVKFLYHTSFISVLRLKDDKNDLGDGKRLFQLVLSVPYPEECFDEEIDAESVEEDPSSLQLEAHIIVTERETHSHNNTNESRSTRDALPFAKLWLDQCSMSHQNCNRQQVQILPTRLVDIRTQNTRLAIDEEIAGFPPYATLSHCWGSTPFLSLTKERLAGFQEHIPSTSLTKTFQDAIETARYLGFGFLWIDSLCIIQDDHEDWAKESALMASVYGNSHLNIAASFATDGTQGCFYPRSDTWECQLSVLTKEGTRIYEYWESSDGYNYSRNALTKTILATRGWIVQESILPHRALHFTKEQLYWTCKEVTCSETFPWGEPLSQGCEIWSPSVLIGGITRSNWVQAVERYSRTKLTKNSDKLVAVAGLARKLHSQTNGQYVAGMWRESLLLDLLWRLERPGRLIVPYTGPSWSWASLDTVDCGLRYNDREPYESFNDSSHYVHLVEIEDAYVKLKTADPFGAILDARLRLRCRFFSRARLEATTGHWIAHKITISGVKSFASMYLDTQDTLGTLPRDVYVVFWIMQIFPYLANCLILLPVEGCPGQYRRVGVLRVDTEFDGEGNLWSRLLDTLPDVEAKDCVEIQEGVEKPYVIELI